MKHHKILAVGAVLLGLLGSTPGEAADFVRVVRANGGAWCFEQGGQRFFSMGVCHAAGRGEPRDGAGRFYDGLKAQGGWDAWGASVVARLTGWGFNTAGAWCDEPVYRNGLYHTRDVWLGAEVDGIKPRLLNVFSRGYEAKIDELCAQFVAPHKNDARLIGWFLDNELPWFGEFGWITDPDRSLLDRALQLPAGDPNRQEATRFLEEHYAKDFARFQHEWETSAQSWEGLAKGGVPKAKGKVADQAKRLWAGVVAERFFRVCVAAVRRHDPNHLILGCRFAGNAPGPVIAACARHCDVVSMNHYAKDGTVDRAWWDTLYALVQKPILLTEFSWRATANRSGNRNVRGVEVTVASQADRGARYARFVPAMMELPYLVGMHWFEWADEPENGRFDGEDSNYGLVDWQDKPYEELVAAAKATNGSLPSPDARRGALPAASDTAGTSWGTKMLARLPAGQLRQAVEFVRDETAPGVSLDDANGSQSTVRRDGDGWRADFDTGHGWGLTLSWPVPSTPLAGAGTLRLKYAAAPGTKFAIVLVERGADNPSEIRKGVADGESWLLGPLEVAKGSSLLELDLREVELNAYHGNQHGNHRLDLEGLDKIGVYIPGSQGRNTLRVSSLVLDR